MRGDDATLCHEVAICGQCGPVIKCGTCGEFQCTGGSGHNEDGTRCEDCQSAHELFMVMHDHLEPSDFGRLVRHGDELNWIPKSKW